MMTAKRKTKKQSLSNNYCIVAFNVVAESYFENLSKSRLTLFIGTLVNINISLNEQLVAIKIVDLEKQYNVSEEELWLCTRDALLHVDKSVWPLLSAVPSPVERVFLLRENDLLDELLKIEVGTLVNVRNSDFDNEYSTAVVKYKGPILKKGPGIYFGVEILDGNCGENDGCFGNQRFFSCPPGTGKCVAINQLYPAHSYAHQSSYQSVQVQNKREKMQKPSYSLTSNIHDYGGICDCERGLLKIGDRVVWLSDEGPVAGVVRRLACSDNSLKVSVQFDEPVRSDEGAGECTRTAVLPALELVKASDFFGASGSDVVKTNGESSWDNGDIDLKKSNDCLNRASQELSTQNSQYTVYEDGGVVAGSGSEGSGYYDTPEGDQVGVGSLVEVSVRGEPHYGVIRWVGTVPGDLRPRRIAGIEMEEELPGLGDGAFNGRRYFQCNPQKALFVNLNQCRRDSRFHENASSTRNHQKNEDFGFVDSPVIPGAIPPISREGDISSICGKFRGIQGHHNSCYLDATLFSMFTFTSVFDSLLYRPALPTDMVHYDQVQKVLREEIVNPLRVNLFVRADRVMKLRTLLEKLSSVSGLTTEEKDPEEFLTSLVAQILRAEPFLKLSSGQEAYHYQLFVEKDEALTFPTVQQLFEQSFLSSDLKLKEVPSCLIIQMPRFGKSFKMYPRILPSQLLDVTDVIEDSPRQCTVCGNLAEFECTQCFEQCDVGLQSISFCGICLETAHNHERRRNHSWKHLKVPLEFTIIKDHCLIPRLYMQLFAVVCIETSHYVTFVKCGTGSDAPWCFFDSMADRKGEQNGYNIPEVVACPDLPYWLSEKGAQVLHQIKDERQLPEHAKRLLCDAYMCMYQSTEVMMYR